ncbi:hypothetical protein B0H14DRAFT_3445004 [Mycena olivaceomarginata]|nr:hypothetical protein B0H14DRAFT_3445004 [Mycena olivaceomarginata]
MPCTPTVEIMARLASLFIGLLAQAAISATASPPTERRATANLVGQIIDALGIGLVTQINASITARKLESCDRFAEGTQPDTLTTDILSIDFEARNPLFFELTRLDRVSSTAGTNDTVYAAFSTRSPHAASDRAPLGRATFGAVHDVRLTQGAMAALDIAGLGAVVVPRRALTVGGKGKGGIPVPISGLHQAGVPTSYNVD